MTSPMGDLRLSLQKWSRPTPEAPLRTGPDGHHLTLRFSTQLDPQGVAQHVCRMRSPALDTPWVTATASRKSLARDEAARQLVPLVGVPPTQPQYLHPCFVDGCNMDFRPHNTFNHFLVNHAELLGRFANPEGREYMAARLAEREPEFSTAEPEGTSPESTPNPPAPRPGEPGGLLVVDPGRVHDRLEVEVNRFAEESGEDLPNV